MRHYHSYQGTLQFDAKEYELQKAATSATPGTLVVYIR